MPKGVATVLAVLGALLKSCNLRIALNLLVGLWSTYESNY